MGEKDKFRKLRADEIECRIARITEKGLQLLLYKDARCDMNILDETVGSNNWQRRHTRDNANCIVSIWDDAKSLWIDKEDTGTESYTEREKGLASDSFKRACFNWGIGRELYTAPFIWFPAAYCNISSKKCYDTFKVQSIGYDGNTITALSIINQKTGAVFEYKNGVGKCDKKDGSGQDKAQQKGSKEKEIRPDESKSPQPVEKPAPATEAQKNAIAALCKKHNVSLDALYISNGLTEKTLTQDKANSVLISLKNKFGDE